MPGSLNKYNEMVQAIITRLPKGLKILDVGPGAGNYIRRLRVALKPHTIDAIEAFEPYVAQYELEKKYNKVMVGDAIDFDGYFDYDIVLITGVFEHFSVERARTLIDKCKAAGNLMLMVIPHNLEQDVGEDGNAFEIHHQPDLTPEVMYERYPEIVCWKVHRRHGFYTGDFGEYINDDISDWLENHPQGQVDTRKFRKLHHQS